MLSGIWVREQLLCLLPPESHFPSAWGIIHISGVVQLTVQL